LREALLRLVTSTDPPIGCEIENVASNSEFAMPGVFESDEEDKQPETVFITIALTSGHRKPERKRKDRE
jgi:hypothetical protein